MFESTYVFVVVVNSSWVRNVSQTTPRQLRYSTSLLLSSFFLRSRCSAIITVISQFTFITFSTVSARFGSVRYSSVHAFLFYKSPIIKESFVWNLFIHYGNCFEFVLCAWTSVTVAGSYNKLFIFQFLFGLWYTCYVFSVLSLYGQWPLLKRSLCIFYVLNRSAHT